jgi:hypothetical protein
MRTRRLAAAVAALAVGVGGAGAYAAAQSDGAAAPAKKPAVKPHKVVKKQAPKIVNAPRGHDCDHHNAVTPAV